MSKITGKQNLNILIRQPFTQSSELEASVISECIDEIERIDGHFARLSLVGGSKAQSNASFREHFQSTVGAPFTPKNFRLYRLSLLRNADAFINIRTGMSESTAFEIAYNIFGGTNIPMFFAIWKHSPIKTTLIRELNDLSLVSYVEFDKPRELRRPLWDFLEAVAARAAEKEQRDDAGDSAFGEPLYSQTLKPCAPAARAGSEAQAPIRHSAALALADGRVFYGQGLGIEGSMQGELCFNTAMSGYQEILSDPSYAGQIVTFSFPHIGNVGANRDDMEASTPRALGCVLRNAVTEPSNHRAEEHFATWLAKHGMIGISDVDTRAITCHLREKGAQNCVIVHSKAGLFDIDEMVMRAAETPSLIGQDLAKDASVEASYSRQSDGARRTDPHIVVIDYGVKGNIVESLCARGARVTVAPSSASAKDILQHEPDGVLLSNGPGDPVAVAPYAVPSIEVLTKMGMPLFGICLGHQLLGLALGGSVSKMHFGHHGADHPVFDKSKNHVLITSQNHGFVVDRDSLPEGVNITHFSLFDGTLAGFEMPEKRILSVQFHPEASPGPHDGGYIFDKFIRMIKDKLSIAA